MTKKIITSIKSQTGVNFRRFGPELGTLLRFFSRLPVGGKIPPDDEDAAGLGTAVDLLPVAGLVIAGPAVVALLLLGWAGMPHLVLAAIAVGITMLATGGLHEDGLADTADGLGGGWDRKSKLEIMRDSRIGSYGVLALIIIVAIRIGAIAWALEWSGPVLAAAVVLASAATSRATILWPWARLQPARKDGLSKSVGQPSIGSLRFAWILAAALSLLLLISSFSLLSILLALAVAALTADIMRRQAWRHLAGQTGDILGATQQLAEVGFLVGLLAFH